jgi:hypothetical protein
MLGNVAQRVQEALKEEVQFIGLFQSPFSPGMSQQRCKILNQILDSTVKNCNILKKRTEQKINVKIRHCFLIILCPLAKQSIFRQSL